MKKAKPLVRPQTVRKNDPDEEDEELMRFVMDEFDEAFRINKEKASLDMRDLVLRMSKEHIIRMKRESKNPY